MRSVPVRSLEQQQAIIDAMNAAERAERQRPGLDALVSGVGEAGEEHARARGWGKWSQPGVPHKGWQQCEDIDDVGDDMEICEMCERTEVRYIHPMSHPDWRGVLRCGCICAGAMAGDVVGARGREREFKNRARRQRSAAVREQRKAEAQRRWREEWLRQREEERQWREAERQRREAERQRLEEQEGKFRKACEHDAKLAERMLALDGWTREERRFLANYGRLMKAEIRPTTAQVELAHELCRQVPQKEAEQREKTERERWEKTKEERVRNGWRWSVDETVHLRRALNCEVEREKEKTK